MTRTIEGVRAAFGVLNKMPDFGRVMEIMFDMSATVHGIITRDKSHAMSDFIDNIEGSRGLFNMVMSWAEEFHVMFEVSDSHEDYISRVDDYTREKFFIEFHTRKAESFNNVLIFAIPEGVTTRAIQILPVIADNGDVIPQFGGPDGDTSHWSVYRRLSDGTVIWELDADTQADAEIIGKALGERYEVDHEPYPWVEEGDNVQA